jgi:hypothetical protein
MQLIRERLSLALHEGHDVGPLFVDLAARNPLALADLVVGPKAQHDPALVRAALAVIGPLEKAVAPNGLYRRLAALSEDTQPEVLALAARRHPAASWMVELSRTVEGNRAGEVHLAAAAGHPAFAAMCWAHAQAGHHPGLVQTAARTGLPEPAAALASVGALDAAAVALIRTLDHTPQSPVIHTLAAAWGPDISPIIRRAIPHLCSRKECEVLLAQVHGYPQVAALLTTVLSAMAAE